MSAFTEKWRFIGLVDLEVVVDASDDSIENA